MSKEYWRFFFHSSGKQRECKFRILYAVSTFVRKSRHSKKNKKIKNKKIETSSILAKISILLDSVKASCCWPIPVEFNSKDSLIDICNYVA